MAKMAITEKKGRYTAAFFTLGCRVNQYETRAMEESFVAHGFDIVDFKPGKFDVCVINTCTVTAESDRKCRNVIRRACAENHGNKHPLIVVVGCYAQNCYAEIAEIDGVGLIIGCDGKAKVAEKVLDILRSSETSENQAPLIAVSDIDKVEICEDMSITASDRTRAFIKIVDGCDNKCTYCVIPQVRGHVRSRSEDDIVQEAKVLASTGYRELVLTGIETAAYGTDIELVRGDALLSLLTKISEIGGIERIRLGSLEPTLFSEAFSESLSKIPKIMPHFHISLQSGSDKVLAAMKRKYNTEMFMRCLGYLRKNFSELSLTTDIIVGFPGETEADFAETVRFAIQCRFAYIHIFPYSRREGTPAAEMKRQHNAAEKKKRAMLLHSTMIDMRHTVLDEYIGKKVKILVETIKGGIATGHSESYIETDFPVELHADSTSCVSVNDIVEVQIKGISNDSMKLLGRIEE